MVGTAITTPIHTQGVVNTAAVQRVAATEIFRCSYLPQHHRKSTAEVIVDTQEGAAVAKAPTPHQQLFRGMSWSKWATADKGVAHS